VLHSDRVCRTFFEPERPRFPSRCSHPVIGVTSRVNRRRAFSGGFPRNRPPCRGSARSGSTPVTRANSQGRSGGSGYCGWSRRRRVLPAKPVSALCWWWSDRAADRPCCGRSRVAWPPRPGRPGGLRAAQADATLGQVHLDRQQLSRRASAGGGARPVELRDVVRHGGDPLRQLHSPDAEACQFLLRRIAAKRRQLCVIKFFRGGLWRNLMSRRLFAKVLAKEGGFARDFCEA
jgi:hypothetical protein